MVITAIVLRWQWWYSIIQYAVAAVWDQVWRVKFNSSAMPCVPILRFATPKKWKIWLTKRNKNNNPNRQLYGNRPHKSGLLFKFGFQTLNFLLNSHTKNITGMNALNWKRVNCERSCFYLLNFMKDKRMLKKTSATR